LFIIFIASKAQDFTHRLQPVHLSLNTLIIINLNP
jgi:hypothetical protein